MDLMALAGTHTHTHTTFIIRLISPSLSFSLSSLRSYNHPVVNKKESLVSAAESHGSTLINSYPVSISHDHSIMSCDYHVMLLY